VDFGAEMRNTGHVVRGGALRDRLAGILGDQVLDVD
jgi:hypothetical protein